MFSNILGQKFPTIYLLWSSASLEYMEECSSSSECTDILVHICVHVTVVLLQPDVTNVTELIHTDNMEK